MDLVERLADAHQHNQYYPGYGNCLCCKRCWPICLPHITQIDTTSGVFPLCEECWQELSPDDRLPYYHMMWRQWIENQDDIEAAIRSGDLTEEEAVREKNRIAHAWPRIHTKVLEER